MERPGVDFIILTRPGQATLQHRIGHCTARSHYIIQNDRIGYRHNGLECIEQLHAYLLELEVN